MENSYLILDKNMVWIDYIIISIIGFSCFISLIRGFIREILSLIVWGCTFFITSHYFVYLSPWLIDFKDELVQNIIAIIILATIVLIIGAVINFIVSQIVKKSGLSGIDRMLGVIFGILRGTLFVDIFLFFLDTFTEFSKSENWQRSQLIPKFGFIIRWIFSCFQDSPNFLAYIIK